MNCGIKIIKLLLFIFNFVFFAFGVAVLALGIVYKLQITSVVNYLGNNFVVAPDLFIAIGTLAGIIAFFGCCGTWKQNRCMLITFTCMLVVLLIIELAVVIIAFLGTNDDSIKNELTNLKEKKNEAFGEIEQQFECCGLLDPSEYKEIPDTCYKDKNRTVQFSEGCISKLKSSLKTIGATIGAVGIIILGIQVLEAIFAGVLASYIKTYPL